MEEDPYFEDAEAAMVGVMEPQVPCRHMATRPCVDLSFLEPQKFRRKLCDPKDCTRYPILDGQIREGY